MAEQVARPAQLDCLAARFEAFKSSAVEEPDRKARNAKFRTILEATCTVVRDAEQSKEPQLAELVEEAHVLLEACLKYAYNDRDDPRPLSTFAHSEDEPWIDDIMETAGAHTARNVQRELLSRRRARLGPRRRIHTVIYEDIEAWKQ